ncbi:MAG TPA: hypothetical protein VFV99_05730 [Kofleriaceae bacterium]|nr:hypothetical protein [Kofleriaceae bacterium]
MALDRRLVIALAVSFGLAGQAYAEAKKTFSVEVVAAEAWRADALGTVLRSDLVDDRQALAETKADIVVHVDVEADGLHYELRALWAHAPAPVRGVIAAGASRTDVAGVLRDRMHRLARHAKGETDAGSALELPAVGTVLLALAGLLALLALPLVFVARARGGVRAALPALREAAVSIAIAGGAAVVLAIVGDVPNAEGIVVGAGGLAWGTWLVATFPIVCPPLVGLWRVEHEALPRVLRLWLVVVVQRVGAVTVLYGPFALVTWFVGDALGLAPATTVALAIPLALIAVRMWLRVGVAVAAVALDRALVDEDANISAWNAATRAYLVGYHTRNGLPLDEHLLSRVQFLPGRGDAVAVYGGGLTDSRIVVPRKLLELALAPAGRPHDYAAPRVSILSWTHWNVGLVMASEPGAVGATREQRQPGQLAVEGEYERVLIGEPPTLGYVVEPSALDERKDHRPHDDPMWLEWDPGDEYDGTDAGDRDFLFGLLVHALGRIRRHEERLHTLRVLAMRVPWLARIGERLKRATRVLLRPSASLADEHAALGGARHHLVQYLAWQLWRRDDLLTARAYAPELVLTTRRVCSELAAKASVPDPELAQRVQRLGALVPGVPATRATRWGRFAVAAVALAGVGLATFAIVDAVSYHPTYVEHVKAETHGKTK